MSALIESLTEAFNALLEGLTVFAIPIAVLFCALTVLWFMQ